MFMRIAAVGMLLLIGSSPALAKKGKWKVLFDGKSTAAWRGYKQESFPDKVWQIDNSTLRTVTGGESRDIITREKFGDFELKLEWKISAGGNSGIIYLVSEDFDSTYKTGPEMQVLDDAKHNDGRNPKTSAGSLYGLIAPVNKKLAPVGQWNKVRVIVKSGHVEHWLNGRRVVSYDLGGEELKPLIAASKFKDYPRFGQNKDGFIALQFHGDEVWYRKIRVRSL